MTATNPYERLYRDFTEASQFDEKFNVQVVYTAKGYIHDLDNQESDSEDAGSKDFCVGRTGHAYGPLTINQPSGPLLYRDVRLSQTHFMAAMDSELIARFNELCRIAGLILPRAAAERYGIPHDETPKPSAELRWLGLIVEALRNHGLDYVKPSKYDCPNETKDNIAGSYCHDTVDRPFLACAKAIEVAGLLKDKQAKPARITQAEANKKAREILRRKPNASIRELADAIPCSTGLVGKLGVWIAIQEERKKNHKPAPPKAVNFSSKMEAVTGKLDPHLQELMDDQARDNEGSPLDPKGLSARIRKRG